MVVDRPRPQLSHRTIRPKAISSSYFRSMGISIHARITPLQTEQFMKHLASLPRVHMMMDVDHRKNWEGGSPQRGLPLFWRKISLWAGNVFQMQNCAPREVP